MAGALLHAGVAQASSPWPDIAMPPRTATEWVAQDTVVNGLPARVERFESELTAAEVLQFYKQQWHGRLGDARALSTPDWQVLSTLSGPFQLVLQVRPKRPAGSEGVISVANFKEFRPLQAPALLPRYGDTEVTQMTESSDGPRASQLVTLVSNAAFDVCVNRLREHWLRHGWGLAFERRGTAQQGGSSWVASFDKPPRSVDLVLTRDAASDKVYITANLLSPRQ